MPLMHARLSRSGFSMVTGRRALATAGYWSAVPSSAGDMERWRIVPEGGAHGYGLEHVGFGSAGPIGEALPALHDETGWQRPAAQVAQHARHLFRVVVAVDARQEAAECLAAVHVPLGEEGRAVHEELEGVLEVVVRAARKRDHTLACTRGRSHTVPPRRRASGAS